MIGTSRAAAARQEIERVVRPRSADARSGLGPSHFGFGYWLSPTGRLWYTPPWSQWELAWFENEPSGLVLPDQRLPGDDRFRVPLLERGWVRLRTRTRAEIEAAVFTEAAEAVVAGVAEVFLTGGWAVEAVLLEPGERAAIAARGAGELGAFLEDLAELGAWSRARVTPKLRA